MKMKFRLLIMLVFCLSCFQKTSNAQTKPNIIVIVADYLGYGSLGCYGQQMIHTPNIDALAAGGIKLTDYYSGSSVCAPSRETMLTGRHTGHTFIRGNFLTDEKEDPAMPSDKTTLAELLKQNGYETALFGKWGLGGEGHGPETQGFDSSFCYLDQIKAHNYYPAFLYENGKKIKIKANANDGRGEYSHHLFAAKTLTYISNRKKDQPFFLFLPYTLPHGEYTLPAAAPYSSKDWKELFKVYATMISLLDSDVGRIVQALKDKGLFENTLIIFTSDNGANLAFAKFFNGNGPYNGAKFGLNEGGIRVPFFAHWNGKIKPARQSNHVCASWDILPTICDAAGIQKPSKIDGVSFLPSLLNQKQTAHEYLYWEYYNYNYNWDKPENNLPRNYLDSRAVRIGKWKGLQQNMYKDKNAAIELYDLSNDAGEKINLAEKNPEIVKQVQQVFKEASLPDPLFFPYTK